MQAYIPQAIQRSAQQALCSLSGHAAVLFGSRARDDWTPMSDWDIAFIAPSTASTLDERPFDGLRKAGYEINCAVVQERVLRERACYLGSFQRAVVRDGVLLAGDYDLDTLRKEPLQMDTQLFVNHILMAEARIRAAAEDYARIAKGQQDRVRDVASSARFVSDSADAAERLAKALLMRLGIDPGQTHDMNALADQAREGGYDEEATLLRSLNGGTKADHVAHYEVQDSLEAGCRRAGPRYAGVIMLYGKMMQRLSEIPSIDKAKQQEETLAVLELVAETFQNADLYRDAGRLPEVEILLSQRETIAQSAVNTLSTYQQALERIDCSGRH